MSGVFYIYIYIYGPILYNDKTLKLKKPQHNTAPHKIINPLAVRINAHNYQDDKKLFLSGCQNSNWN